LLAVAAGVLKVAAAAFDPEVKRPGNPLCSDVCCLPGL